MLYKLKILLIAKCIQNPKQTIHKAQGQKSERKKKKKNT